MNTKIFKPITAIIIALFAFSNIHAQDAKIMCVMKDGVVVRQVPVSEIDSIVFYDTVPIGDGVTINGVTWATRNVAAPGIFADNPEDAGMFYQWNRKIGWSSTDPMINSNGGTIWDFSDPIANTWEKANDPSPAGWRVPNSVEILSLINAAYVAREWATQNGVLGIKFTDKTSGNSLFLPTVGNRISGKLNHSDSNRGFYWSSTPNQYTGSHNGVVYLCSDSLWLGNDYGVPSAYVMFDEHINAFSVRCVRE